MVAVQFFDTSTGTFALHHFMVCSFPALDRVRRIGQSVVVAFALLLSVNGVAGHRVSKATNVILFVGDGMGVSTVTAARILEAQLRGETGEENALSFEAFPHVALIKTYASNAQVADSASTVTALVSGHKTDIGMINVHPRVPLGDCDASHGASLQSIGELAVRKGHAVGIVSTARVTHATPAGMYGHTPYRGWESGDDDVPTGCKPLAQQMLEFPFHIVLGGGAVKFGGLDSPMLKNWSRRVNGHVVGTRQELLQLPKDKTPVLGLFTPSHMSYEKERQSESGEPSLTDMTKAAIAHLSAQDTNGYVLMVEGGRIDHGHHDNRPDLALTDAVEFASAVTAALKSTSRDDTLIIVTADHSHVFTIAGYPHRGNDILGVVKSVDRHGEPRTDPSLDENGVPYTTLGYANGPGAETTFDEEGQRVPPGDANERWQALVNLGSETHGGEDVAAYAIGPGSSRVHGVMDQERLFYVMTKALGWTRPIRASDRKRKRHHKSRAK